MPPTGQNSPLHILITAGPTREYLDPVRFISNGSTGKMGYACADAAVLHGHRVTLISGPVSLQASIEVDLIEVVSSDEMAQAVFANFAKCDCVIMTAAVGDYRPKEIASHKIKKSGRDLTLSLEPTIDILATLGQRKQNQILIGFAVEDTHAHKHAQDKLRNKNLDAIVLNSPAALGADDSVVEILKPDGSIEALPLLSKNEIANHLIEFIELMRMTRPT